MGCRRREEVITDRLFYEPSWKHLPLISIFDRIDLTLSIVGKRRFNAIRGEESVVSLYQLMGLNR